MRPFLAVLVFLAGLVVWPSLREVAVACGDKALTVGRGIKYGRAYAALHPGTVALYARPGAPPLGPHLDTQLKRAGHRVVMAVDASSLREALGSVPIDIVLASLADAETVESNVAAATSHPSFVCVNVGDDTTKAGTDAPRQCRLKASDQATRFLAEIDQVMKARISASRQSSRR
jgi:hypothetical protein